MIEHFCPTDMQRAADKLGAACGHGALAAALACPVILAVPLFDRGGWVNIPMMKAAIARAERQWLRVDRPDHVSGYGVAMVQFLGPWMNAGVPPAARCAYRHWIAIAEGSQEGALVWDANLEMWLSLEHWERWIPSLYPEKATGHALSWICAIGPSDEGKAPLQGKLSCQAESTPNSSSMT